MQPPLVTIFVISSYSAVSICRSLKIKRKVTLPSNVLHAITRLVQLTIFRKNFFVMGWPTIFYFDGTNFTQQCKSADLFFKSIFSQVLNFINKLEYNYSQAINNFTNFNEII